MSGYLSRTPADTDRVRLFCFAHAGAGASAYAAWVNALGSDVGVYPVQLPGREARATDPRHIDREKLLDEIEVAIGPHLDRPHLFYGHSLGALLALALTQRRLARADDAPRALVVGAYPAPHLGPPLTAGTLTSDEELADELVRIGGMSATLRGYPAWVESAISLLRDDLALLRGPIPRGPLPVPLHVIAGTDDPLVEWSAIAPWREWAGSTVAYHKVPGGHLFLHDSRDTLIGLIADIIAERAGAR